MAFSDVIWIIVTVADQSLNGLTQQLSTMSSLGSLPHSDTPSNVYNSFTSTTSQTITHEVSTTIFLAIWPV